MFLSSYEKMREWLLENKTIQTLTQVGYNSFPELNSKVVQVVMFVIQNLQCPDYKGTYINLNSAPHSANKNDVFLNRTNEIEHIISSDDFTKISGYPIVYWANKSALVHFSLTESLGEIADLRSGISTGENEVFYRSWFELSRNKINFIPEKIDTGKWFPIIRGGDFRRWYGNRESVINLENDGADIIGSGNNFRLRSKEYYTKTGVTWSRITSGPLSFRIKTEDVNFGENSPCLFSSGNEKLLLSLLNSKVSGYFLSLLSPTLSNQVVDVAKIPAIISNDVVTDCSDSLIEIYRSDWDSSEISWNFLKVPLVDLINIGELIEYTWSIYKKNITSKISYAKRIEEQNNRLFIDAYGLQDELDADVPLEQITLTINPKYRYGGNLNDEQLAQRFQADTLAELISYAIGCMMGRYSLDEPGLIYAHAGNIDFDPASYQTFAADDDGIIPLTDQDWFKDDATNRFRDFVRTVWGEENLQENLSFVAESLCFGALTAKRGEQSLETIRRYLSNQFYKDHLKTYKKRPIYWLFSSGKQKAFEGLVYLHRYNDSTLPRMRTEYVTPLLGKYDAYADQLKKQLEDATTSEATLLNKELLALEKKQTELRAFDDNLKHYADRRIKLDLDDGVKVNYGKFGDLLAEVKAVTGGKE